MNSVVNTFYILILQFFNKIVYSIELPLKPFFAFLNQLTTSINQIYEVITKPSHKKTLQTVIFRYYN